VVKANVLKGEIMKKQIISAVIVFTLGLCFIGLMGLLIQRLETANQNGQVFPKLIQLQRSKKSTLSKRDKEMIQELAKAQAERDYIEMRSLLSKTEQELRAQQVQELRKLRENVEEIKKSVSEMNWTLQMWRNEARR